MGVKLKAAIKRQRFVYLGRDGSPSRPTIPHGALGVRIGKKPNGGSFEKLQKWNGSASHPYHLFTIRLRSNRSNLLSLSA